MSNYVVREFRYAPGSLSHWRPDERRSPNPNQPVPRDEVCLSILPPGIVDEDFTVHSAFVDINLGPSPTEMALNSDKMKSAFLPENTFGFVTPGTDFRLKSTNNMPCVLLEIGDDVLKQWTEAAEIDPSTVAPFQEYRKDQAVGAFGNAAASVLNRFECSGGTINIMTMEALVLGISSRLLAQLSDHSSGAALLSAARQGVDRRLAVGLDYAMANLSDPGLKVADMAVHANLSPHHFAELFKAWKGVSPYAFIRAERLKLAQRILSTTDLPIAAVAYETGFSSQSHLTTAFKEAYGVTPGKHRSFA